LFKKEDWIEQSEPELRKPFIQYLGSYISEFRKVGWNHGNNVHFIYLFIYLFILIHDHLPISIDSSHL